MTQARTAVLKNAVRMLFSCRTEALTASNFLGYTLPPFGHHNPSAASSTCRTGADDLS
jgi:hypothetical protein